MAVGKRKTVQFKSMYEIFLLDCISTSWKLKYDIRCFCENFIAGALTLLDFISLFQAYWRQG